MLNCYCQLSSSVIFRQYGVSQSECKIDRPRPGLPRLSPRPHTEALGTRLGVPSSSGIDIIDGLTESDETPPVLKENAEIYTRKSHNLSTRCVRNQQTCSKLVNKL